MHRKVEFKAWLKVGATPLRLGWVEILFIYKRGMFSFDLFVFKLTWGNHWSILDGVGLLDSNVDNIFLGLKNNTSLYYD